MYARGQFVPQSDMNARFYKMRAKELKEGRDTTESGEMLNELLSNIQETHDLGGGGGCH